MATVVCPGCGAKVYLHAGLCDLCGRSIEDLARLHREREEQARREAEHRRQQEECHRQMAVLLEQSLALFESLPTHLDSAEKWLDQAEVDFADGAFAPFWDSIENAAKRLAHFDERVRHIKDHSSRYTELARRYEDTPPQFPVAPQSVARLGVGKTTADRLKAIVRTAQRNFQFATIYEQRKTNQILVAGFTNLAQALERMAWQITASIDDLAGSIDAMTSTLDDSIRAIHSRLGDVAEAASQRHRELVGEASQRAAREQKALEMLDNIQHRRRPFS